MCELLLGQHAPIAIKYNGESLFILKRDSVRALIFRGDMLVLLYDEEDIEESDPEIP